MRLRNKLDDIIEIGFKVGCEDFHSFQQFCGGIMCTRCWTFELPKRWNISWQAEQLSVSQIVFYSMEFVSYKEKMDSHWVRTWGSGPFHLKWKCLMTRGMW